LHTGCRPSRAVFLYERARDVGKPPSASLSRVWSEEPFLRAPSFFSPRLLLSLLGINLGGRPFVALPASFAELSVFSAAPILDGYAQTYPKIGLYELAPVFCSLLHRRDELARCRLRRRWVPGLTKPCVC